MAVGRAHPSPHLWGTKCKWGNCGQLLPGTANSALILVLYRLRAHRVFQDHHVQLRRLFTEQKYLAQRVPVRVEI